MVDDKRRDKWCATMTQAMGRSLNTVFARLAAKNLDRDKLGGVAARYGWGQERALRREDRAEHPRPSPTTISASPDGGGLLELDALALPGREPRHRPSPTAAR